MDPKKARIRKWSEARFITKNTPKGEVRKQVQVYLWQCWHPDCMDEGKPRAGTTSLFQVKCDLEITAHRQHHGEDIS